MDILSIVAALLDPLETVSVGSRSKEGINCNIVVTLISLLGSLGHMLALGIKEPRLPGLISPATCAMLFIVGGAS